MKHFFLITFFALAACAVVLPSSAHAATKRPSCELTVTTPAGEEAGKEVTVAIASGEKVEITWESRNAKTAEDTNGESIDHDGSLTYQPEKSITYSYRFKSGSKSVACSVEVVVAKVTIDPDALASTSGKPHLYGEASGVRNVRVVVRSDKGKLVWKSKDLKVKSGKWSATLKKRPADGEYDVRVYGTKELKNVVLATGTLVVGESSEASVTGGSIAVSPIPLLFGGTARAGSWVPVAYVKVANTGSTDAAIRGFRMRQNGSAPASTVIGFETSDDKGGSRATIGNVEGKTPFVGTTAFVPLPATLAPGQFRIFTLKAILGASASAHVGTQLMIDVASVDTGASVTGVLPMKGTIWTLTY